MIRQLHTHTHTETSTGVLLHNLPFSIVPLVIRNQEVHRRINPKVNLPHQKSSSSRHPRRTCTSRAVVNVELLSFPSLSSRAKFISIMPAVISRVSLPPPVLAAPVPVLLTGTHDGNASTAKVPFCRN